MKKILLQHKLHIALGLLALLIFFLNAFHESYPDEMIKIVGGHYMTYGRLPYGGFFSNHGPVGYITSFVINLISGVSFVRFRIVYNVFLFLLLILSFGFIKLRVSKVRSYAVLAFMLLVGLSATYFWGNMLIADSLASYYLVIAYAMLFFKLFYREKFELVDVGFVAIFSCLGLLTSLTYFFVVIFVNLITCIYFIRDHGLKRYPIVLKAIGLLVAPYLIFVIYFILSGTLNDYIFQSITFTKDIYVYNYPRAEGSTMINPIRYAIVIAHEFFNNFYPVVMWIRNFDIVTPFNTTLAVTNIVLLIVLIARKRWSVALLALVCIVYANARSNPMTSQETDYQSAVYIMITLLNSTIVAYEVFILNEYKTIGKKVLIGFCGILFSVYWFYNGLFLFSKFELKFFGKYMGIAPLIYDRPSIAPVVNRLLGTDDYYWVGPFEPEELHYVQSHQLASKYHFVLPPILRSDKIKGELLADWMKNKPKLIVYFTEFSHSSGREDSFDYSLLQYLHQNYVTVDQLTQNKDFPYATKLAKMGKFDFDRHFFFDKARQDEIVLQLLELGYVGPR